jgi:hypothetical protein
MLSLFVQVKPAPIVSHESLALVLEPVSSYAHLDFVELDCGYWSGDQERRLRERMPE